MSAGEPTEIERRFAELEDPDGPTFVSPSGDRRERAVPCQRCRRSKTFALRGVCVPCLEAELELCDHVDDERVERIAHGYLGDAPAGTRELLCAGCGSEVER